MRQNVHEVHRQSALMSRLVGALRSFEHVRVSVRGAEQQFRLGVM